MRFPWSNASRLTGQLFWPVVPLVGLPPTHVLNKLDKRGLLAAMQAILALKGRRLFYFFCHPSSSKLNMLAVYISCRYPPTVYQTDGHKHGSAMAQCSLSFLFLRCSTVAPAL